jgi:hypothetical protein
MFILIQGQLINLDNIVHIDRHSYKVVSGLAERITDRFHNIRLWKIDTTHILFNYETKEKMDDAFYQIQGHIRGSDQLREIIDAE